MAEHRESSPNLLESWANLKNADVDSVTDWAWVLPKSSWNKAAEILLKDLQDRNADSSQRQLAAAALQAMPPHGSEDPDSGEWDHQIARRVLAGLAEVLSNEQEVELLAACLSASYPFARRASFDLSSLHGFESSLRRALIIISGSEEGPRYKSFVHAFSEDISRLQVSSLYDSVRKEVLARIKAAQASVEKERSLLAGLMVEIKKSPEPTSKDISGVFKPKAVQKSRGASSRRSTSKRAE